MGMVRKNIAGRGRASSNVRAHSLPNSLRLSLTQNATPRQDFERQRENSCKSIMILSRMSTQSSPPTSLILLILVLPSPTVVVVLR
jgi:hypothetical protein